MTTIDIAATQENISAYVRTMLGYRGQNVTYLSQAIGISQWAIGRRLDGQVAWTLPEVETLADEFSVPVEDILSGVPEPPWRFE